MTKEILINANETLLTVYQYGNHQMFAGDSPIFGKTMTADEVLDEVGDSDKIVGVVKFNRETLTGEDITERLARHWLIQTDSENFGISDEIMPAFVKASRAWSLWQDDIQAEEPVANVYSTLNHATQGLSVRGATL